MPVFRGLRTAWMWCFAMGLLRLSALLERSRLRTARCRLRRIRHRWHTRRMPLLLAASQSQRRPPHLLTKPPSTPTACGLFPACGTATRTSRNGLRRWADWTSSMPVPPPKRWTCCVVIWMSAAPPARLTQMPSWWACDSVTRCGPTTSSPHWPQLTP